VAAAIHGLAWLVLSDGRRAEGVAPRVVESTPLAIQLLTRQPERRIELEPRPKPKLKPKLKPGGGQPSRNRVASKADSPNAGHRLEATQSNSEAARPDAKSFDWQSDLNSIRSSRSSRYGRAQSALGASSTVPDTVAGSGDAPLARGISKSARADCRNRYAAMGLLALPALALDAARDDGCRW
jgi:hypothetical protein